MKKDTNLLDTQDVRAEAATALTPNATNGEKIKALRSAQGNEHGRALQTSIYV